EPVSVRASRRRRRRDWALLRTHTARVRPWHQTRLEDLAAPRTPSLAETTQGRIAIRNLVHETFTQPGRFLHRGRTVIAVPSSLPVTMSASNQDNPSTGAETKMLRTIAATAIVGLMAYSGLALATNDDDDDQGGGSDSYSIGLFGDVPYNALGRSQYP